MHQTILLLPLVAAGKMIEKFGLQGHKKMTADVSLAFLLHVRKQRAALLICSNFENNLIKVQNKKKFGHSRRKQMIL